MAKQINLTIVHTVFNGKYIDTKTFTGDYKQAREYIDSLEAEMLPFKPKRNVKYYEQKTLCTITD